MIRKNNYDPKTGNSGFTFFELLVFICIVAILVSIGVPAFSKWIPDYRLRCKAQELYADMHLAKIKSIRENDRYRIVFSTNTPASYKLINPGGKIEKTVTLASSNHAEEISFGCGAATKNATRAGGEIPDDGISYNSNTLTFNPGGTGSAGYAYLYNSRGTSYAIGTLSSGVIFIKKWNIAGNSWN